MDVHKEHSTTTFLNKDYCTIEPINGDYIHMESFPGSYHITLKKGFGDDNFLVVSDTALKHIDAYLSIRCRLSRDCLPFCDGNGRSGRNSKESLIAFCTT